MTETTYKTDNKSQYKTNYGPHMTNLGSTTASIMVHI